MSTLTVPLPPAPAPHTCTLDSNHSAGPSRQRYNRNQGQSGQSQSSNFGTILSDEEGMEELGNVVRAVRLAKRVVVICGAGVSTAAQIPDFRSAAGLYYGVDGTGTCTGAGAGAEAENGTNHDESGERLIGESPRSTHTSTGAAPGTATPQSQRRNRGDPTIRELFHIKALTTESLRPAQNVLFTQLHRLATDAHPTPFHSFLATLEKEGRLLRCYTQNIDGLEGKVGLSVGVPAPVVRAERVRKRRKIGAHGGEGGVQRGEGKGGDGEGEERWAGGTRGVATLMTPMSPMTPEKSGDMTSLDQGTPTTPTPVGNDIAPYTPVGRLDYGDEGKYGQGPGPGEIQGMYTPPSTIEPNGTSSKVDNSPSSFSTPTNREFMPSTPPSSVPTQAPVAAPAPMANAVALINPTPRVIPLHGQLDSLRCTLCAYTVPITSHLPLPCTLIACPECQHLALLRSALSERARPAGFLRPNIVLYGEEHPSGHLIGKVVEKDLVGGSMRIVDTPLSTPGAMSAACASPRTEMDFESHEGLGSLGSPPLQLFATPSRAPSRTHTFDRTPTSAPRLKRTGKADMLIVAGTSLSIPGVKRIVKEFAKAIDSASSGVARRSDRPRVIFVNDEPPALAAQWDGVFDRWVQGDVQRFVEILGGEEVVQSGMGRGVGGGRAVKTNTPKTPKILKTPRTAKTIKTTKTPRTGALPKTPKTLGAAGMVGMPTAPRSISSHRDIATSEKDAGRAVVGMDALSSGRKRKMKLSVGADDDFTRESTRATMSTSSLGTDDEVGRGPGDSSSFEEPSVGGSGSGRDLDLDLDGRSTLPSGQTTAEVLASVPASDVFDSKPILVTKRRPTPSMMRKKTATTAKPVTKAAVKRSGKSVKSGKGGKGADSGAGMGTGMGYWSGVGFNSVVAWGDEQKGKGVNGGNSVGRAQGREAVQGGEKGEVIGEGERFWVDEKGGFEDEKRFRDSWKEGSLTPLSSDVD